MVRQVDVQTVAVIEFGEYKIVYQLHRRVLVYVFLNALEFIEEKVDSFDYIFDLMIQIKVLIKDKAKILCFVNKMNDGVVPIEAGEIS